MQITGTVTKSSESSELSVEINVSANLSPVPEPSGIAATLGLAALAFAARKIREK